MPLIGQPPYNEYYGDLQITLDTARYGEEFVSDSVVIFFIGILRALTLGIILYLIYEWLLTRPLTKLIEHLAHINPDHPGEHKLPLLKGHERNELGLWVETANGLLGAIEHNMRLRQQAESSLQRMTLYDALTGLPNRQQLQRQLDHILDEARRTQRKVAVLCLGLDDFKGINERYSYQAGDRLLVALAERLGNLSGHLGTLRAWAVISSSWCSTTSTSPTRQPSWRRKCSTTWKRRSTSTINGSGSARRLASPCFRKMATARKNSCKRPSRP